jgi:hypothetical protein
MLSVNLSGRMTGYTEVMLDHNSVVGGAAVPAVFKRLIRRHNFLLSPDKRADGTFDSPATGHDVR